MAWQQEFPQFERNYYALLDNLNLNFLSELDIYHRGKLLQLTIVRGWRMMKFFGEQHPEKKVILKEGADSFKESLNINGEPELNFTKEEVREMDWEIREIILPAFSSLYHFFKDRLAEASSTPQRDHGS